VSAPDYLWMRQDPVWSKQLVLTPQIDTYGELMNVEMKPFDNVWFRRAVSSAIDRSKIQRLRNGRVSPTSSWIPPGLDGYEEGQPYQTYDPALAKECMKKAGYPDGYPDVIPYLSITDESSRLTAESIQQDLAAIGVRIEIRSVTFPVYLTSTGRKDTVPFAYTAWVMDYPHPSNFLQTRFACDQIADENSNNDSRYCNPEVDALFARAMAEPDPDAQVALWKEAQRRVLEDAPYAVEYHSVVTTVTHPTLKGFRPNPIYSRDMRRVWLDLPTGRSAP
jgi:ABC-type transport system substrate-binding protein